MLARWRHILRTLTREFRDNFKQLSDTQLGYEERTKLMLKRFAKSDGSEPLPALPTLVWDSLARLSQLSDFIGEACEYKARFEDPLDCASRSLRNELARIIGRT